MSPIPPCYALGSFTDERLDSDTATTVRNMMFTAMAHQVKTVKENPAFTDYYQRRKQDHILKLWQLVGPLLTGDDTNAGEDLGKIIADGFTLSLDINATTFETRFHFPETNEAFDPETMLNLDPWLNNDPYASVRGSDKNKVKLGITPITKIGDNSVTPSRVRLVHLAKVLLRLPNNKEFRTVFVEREISPKKGGFARLPINGLFDNCKGPGDKA